MRTSILTLLAIIIGALFYILRVSFSTHHEYSYKSVDYYILAPSELSVMARLCKNKPAFTSRLVSGPNSVDITTMNCTIPRNILEDHLKNAGFQPNEKGENAKENTEIEVLTNDLGDKVTSVTLFVF